MRFAFVSTWPPRRCGIATFTSDLREAVHEADPRLTLDVAAIDEPHVARAYGAEVKYRISQGSRGSYASIGDARLRLGCFLEAHGRTSTTSCSPTPTELSSTPRTSTCASGGSSRRHS